MGLTAVLGGPGKTGCAYLVRQLLTEGLETKTALMTTRHSFVLEEPLSQETERGWREALSNVLERARRVGCTHTVLTLPLDRLWAGEVAALRLETAVVTGLQPEEVEPTADFLQTHATQLVCNLDDPGVRRLLSLWQGPCCTYAETRSDADVAGRNLRLLPRRTEFDGLTRQELCRISLPVRGGFDLYQGLAALSWGQLHGLTLKRCATVLRHAVGERGCMELGEMPDGRQVLSDWADTPERLEWLLLAARRMTQGKLVLVLSVSGDVPPAQRLALGLRARMADKVCLTGKRGQVEMPADFFRELHLGAGHWHSTVCPVYARALQWAQEEATPKDLVVLAGEASFPASRFPMGPRGEGD